MSANLDPVSVSAFWNCPDERILVEKEFCSNTSCVHEKVQAGRIPLRMKASKVAHCEFKGRQYPVPLCDWCFDRIIQGGLPGIFINSRHLAHPCDHQMIPRDEVSVLIVQEERSAHNSCFM